ncbi:MAG TPA: multiheme c-type cytochrome, partial [Polyangiaceae bacterium]|nr:multiheme c-type cytochrome [Polyangiaceae bacterium]
MRALLALVLPLSLAALVAACRKPPPVPAEEPLPTLPAVGEFLPPALDVPDYVGAAACAECHRSIFDAWQRSPHGRSMAEASPATVLAGFDGPPMTLADGTVSFSRDGDGFFMDIASRTAHERRKVDVVLASGRQHQLYAVKGPDGAMSLLPVVWGTKVKQWLPLSLYQAAELDPASPKYWGAQDMTKGCVSCHLSQAYRRLGPEGPKSAYVDLSVNCEACHGAGAEHVKRRRAGRTDEVYRSLADLGSVDESRVCGGCHGFQLKRYVFPPADDKLPQIFVMSLLNESLRPDGTQHGTSYQYPAHVLSAGFREKVLRCKDCHAPHGLEARDKLGESAVGALSNRQCTDCHEELVAPAPVAAHSHHPASVRCVDCHMSYSWVGDDDHKHQRTSDHSISIPHPAESIAFGTPNACTTCHTGKTPEWSLAALRRWKAKNALGVRDWVETIAMARKVAPGAVERLAKLLTDPTTVPYLKASALDLLLLQPHDASLVPMVAPYATDPDPYLRARAIRLLDELDPPGRARWRAMGLADAHPYVRMETFSMVKDVETLSSQAIDRQLADVLEYMSPPTDGVVHVLTVRHRRGELREAEALVGLLERITLPRERQHLNL